MIMNSWPTCDCSFFHNLPPLRMPLICDEILLLTDVSLDAELRYVVLPMSDPMPDVVVVVLVVTVSGSVLVLLRLPLLMALRRLDDLAGTGGGILLAATAVAVVVAVSVTIRRSVTVVMVIVSTTYLWLLGLVDDERVFLCGFFIFFVALSSASHTHTHIWQTVRVRCAILKLNQIGHSIGKLFSF